MNRFVSGWGLENYHRSGQPIYSEALAAEPVPMLLANNVVLRGLFHDASFDRRLLPEDDRILRGNYIPHWGRVFVAGKVIAPGERPIAFNVAVPGRYTVEGGGIEIDGKYHSSGSVVTLARGSHSISGDRPIEVTLRWGDHLARPAFGWPEGRIFTLY